MVKVDLWMLVENQEFYGYLEFDHEPSIQEVGVGVWEKYNNFTAYYAQWEGGATSQADIYFIEENPDYGSDFKSKLENFLD